MSGGDRVAQASQAAEEVVYFVIPSEARLGMTKLQVLPQSVKSTLPHYSKEMWGLMRGRVESPPQFLFTLQKTPQFVTSDWACCRWKRCDLFLDGSQILLRVAAA
jgi:hypothetical protein